jgi:hypothetical protein
VGGDEEERPAEERGGSTLVVCDEQVCCMRWGDMCSWRRHHGNGFSPKELKDVDGKYATAGWMRRERCRETCMLLSRRMSFSTSIKK